MGWLAIRFSFFDLLLCLSDNCRYLGLIFVSDFSRVVSSTFQARLHNSIDVLFRLTLPNRSIYLMSQFCCIFFIRDKLRDLVLQIFLINTFHISLRETCAIGSPCFVQSI